MISVRCRCGGEFWVRDRLAGQAARCPTCEEPMVVPGIDEVRGTMTSLTCSCGEVFWSSRWQEGRRIKCPICRQRIAGDEASPTGTASSSSTADGTARSSPRWPRVLTSPRFGVVAGSFLVILLAFGFMIFRPAPRVSEPPGAIPPPPTDQDTKPDRPSKSPTTKLKLLVPAYFYPGGDELATWKKLIDAADRVPIIAVVNPESGPGQASNPEYKTIIDRAARSGITLIGYVNTDYARRDIARVLADLDRWLELYPGIGGAFFDAQASGPEHVDYYVQLREAVAERFEDPLVVTNPGAVCDPAYFRRDATDLGVLFETSESFDTFTPPRWFDEFAGAPFAALPYGVDSAEAMKEVLKRCVFAKLGYVYISDRGSPNPWDELPSYWEEEVQAVERINQGLMP